MLRGAQRVEVSSIYHRFIAGPTLNNSKKKVESFWKLSLNVVENVAKVEFFSFFDRVQFFHFNELFN